MPALGVAQEKGILIRWLKAEGEPVTKGEPLMEVETDKATVEIEAPASGILASVTAFAGDEVPVGHRIAVLLAKGEKFTATAQSQPESPAPEAPRPVAAQAEHKTIEDKPRTTRIPLASPAARRLAREKGIDLSSLRGTGPQGAVLAHDVLQSKPAPSSASEGPADIRETIKLTRMRRIVGERMTRSKQTAPHFYISMDIDMTEVSQRRMALKEKGGTLVPTINDFLLAAAARALRDFPSLNATFLEQGVQVYSDINLGMAVALEEGLVVPVIRNADRLSLAALAQQSRELAEKAQKKKLLPLDYEGGTFTVSNLGMLGVDSFVAIINPPQCAILAAGRVALRVIADDDGMMTRSMMTATLSADHRIVDGAIAARFLQEVKRLLENPDI
jgi:pyruvate dehydrogenase E2 component (dihydrolipoamide acetyltransferase)